MSNIVPFLKSDREVGLVRRIVGEELTNVELDHFIHMCREWRLDPLRKQIYALVYKGKTRRVTYVTGIDGYRSIAARSGNYRPGDRTCVINPEHVDPKTNPLGIVSASASVYKFAHGEWFEVRETVFWEEFAPIREDWNTKEKSLDMKTQWPKMGRIMLQKCAEAQALRRAWPDELSGLYVTEETDRGFEDNMIDITPHEQAERAEVADRIEKIGGGAKIYVNPLDGEPTTAIPVGAFFDYVCAFLRDNPHKASLFEMHNQEGLRLYWAHAGNDALELKKILETAIKAEEKANEEASE